jgi:hypothetical protein
MYKITENIKEHKSYSLAEITEIVKRRIELPISVENIGTSSLGINAVMINQNEVSW